MNGALENLRYDNKKSTTLISLIYSIQPIS